MEQYGLYDERYQIAADSDFLVRYLYKADLKVGYLGKYVVRMRMGGLSTDSQKRKTMWKEDVEMFRKNGFWGVPEKILKMGWKVPQFVNAKLKREFKVE
jgi:glycosyltransferase